MSADPKSVTQAAADADSERFVQIPRAKPGQEYKAPKNMQQPLITGFYRLAVIALCLSLPVAPAAIFAMILILSHAISLGFLWVWIPMIILVEAIAIFVAWGVASEALGYAGVSYIRGKR